MANLIGSFLICLAVAFGLQAQTVYFDSHLNTEGAVNYCGADTGSVNVYTCTNVVGARIGSYQIGKTYTFKATHTNSGAATLSIDGLATVTIKKQQGVSDLTAVDIVSGATVSVLYDGTFFEMASLPGNPVGAINLAPNTFTVWNVGGGLTYYTLQAPATSGSGLTGLTGDGSATGFGTVPLVLPSINPDSGTFGDASHCIIGLTTNAKGLITGIAQSTSCPGAGGAGGTVTAFSAPTGGFPAWLVPSVLNSTTTPALSVSVTSQGNGGKVQLSTGSTVTNDCVKFDANGNTVDAGAVCGSGFYQTFLHDSTAVTPRVKFNLAAGSNMTITATDNGTDTTTFTLASSGGGGSGGWSIGLLSALPGTCAVGAAYFATDNPRGLELYLCTAANTWTQDKSIGGSGGLLYTAGVLDINPATMPFLANANAFTALQSMAAGYKIVPVLVSVLPGSCVQGTFRTVSDALSPVAGTTIAGGGSLFRPVVCDSTWKSLY